MIFFQQNIIFHRHLCVFQSKHILGLNRSEMKWEKCITDLNRTKSVKKRIDLSSVSEIDFHQREDGEKDCRHAYKHLQKVL